MPDHCDPISGDMIAYGLRARVQMLEAENERLRAALAMIYDKYEDGNSCYEDIEDCTGFLGNAVRLSESEEKEILALIPKERSSALEPPGSDAMNQVDLFTATADLPEFLPYREAMDELFVHLQAQKLPKVVHALLGATLQNPVSLVCLVGDAELAAGTPRVVAGLYASKLLKKLLFAVRALDWELIADALAHAVTPVELRKNDIEITQEMVEAGEEVIVGEIGSSAGGLFFSASSLAEKVYRAMCSVRDESL